MPSKLQYKLNAAIIMDGNGRWAGSRGLPRAAGHKAGVEALRRTAEAAADLGIGALTVYAFSSDNWQRPKAEVSALMALFRRYLASETGRLLESGIRFGMIGRRDRLPSGLPRLIASVEAATAHCRGLYLRIAFDYSARDAIVDAASCLSAQPSREALGQQLSGGLDRCEVDLLIRSGGEKRLSDFLLWESAYAELYFTDRLWPDFGPADLAEAVAEFWKRDRRYGGINAATIALQPSLGAADANRPR